MAEGLPVPTFHGSEMYLNRKQIFCGVMQQASIQADHLIPIQKDLERPERKPGQKEWGPWHVGSHMMGETIPKETNTVSLITVKKTIGEFRSLNINISYDDNDAKMKQDFFDQFTEMYTKAGFTNIKTTDSKQAPGLDIHEMGGVRMGNDPKTSMLNKWNQLHACKNVFVTDGACMTSTSTQNPSLTYMALAARAADFAVAALKRGEM